MYLSSLIVFSALLISSVNGQFDGNFTLRNIQSRLPEGRESSLIYCLDSNGNGKKIQFSRVLDTGQGPSLPEGTQGYLEGNSEAPNAKILQMLSEKKNSSFGVFQCQIINGGVNTTIATLKLPPLGKAKIDAKQPYISVSKGENVKLEMIQRVKSSLPIVWAHNGHQKPEWKDKLQVEIQNVKTTDGGIYECYYEGSRNEGLHGILRLIVRACPSGKFGSFCEKPCPSCYNGGVCHDSSGQCICPSGFTGGYCERACGGNLIGANCETKCIVQDQESGCAFHLFCKPDPYGCSCPPGYKGPECGDACEPGRYGADCKQHCHCLNGEPCNRITGACKNGCAAQWKGDSCQAPVPVDNVANSPSSTVPSVCEPGKFGDNCEKRCHCLGGVACDKETGACNRKCDNFWDGIACNVCIEGRFGENCEYICHCINGSSHCNKTTGECDAGCEAGWSGFSCQEACPPDKFGVNCIHTCDCQNNGTCNKVNGTCECIDKWKGKSCTDKMPQIISTSDGGETNTGQHFEIACIAEAIPPPKLLITSRVVHDFPTVQSQWRRKHEYKALSNVTVTVAGNITFECTAENIHGYRIRTFIIQVIDPPVLKERPEVIEAFSHAVSLVWKNWAYGVDEGGKEEDRVDYLVLYRQLGMSKWNQIDNWIPETNAVVQNLEPDMEYEFAVKCRRPGKGGEGKRSPVTLARTQCGSASMDAIPHDFQAKNVTPRSVILSWKPPSTSELQCSLNGYMLRYYEGVRVHDLKYINISSIEEKYSLEELQPLTSYVFQLFAMTWRGRVQNYAEIKISTPADVPGPVQNLEYKLTLKPSVVLIIWSESAIKNGNIEIYRVTYKLISQGFCEKPENSDTLEETQIIHAPQTKGELNGLLPFSVYNVSVEAATVAGYGRHNTIIVKTLQSTPSSSPQNVRTTKVRSTELELLWDPVACDKANGEITAYEYGLQNTSGRLEKKRHAKQTSRKDADKWIIPLTKLKDNKVKLISLTPYTKYGFVVRAYTKSGPGPFSPTLYVETADDVPLPPSVRISSISNESLTVNWKPPSPSHGVIIKFRFHLWLANYKQNITSHTILYDPDFKNDLKYTFNYLEPYKQYFVQIQAATRVGWGNWSNVVSEWTKEGIPGPPTEISVESHRNMSITVSWSPPIKPNGIIKNYKVLYHPETHGNNGFHRDAPTEHILSNETLHATFSRLQPNTEYSFSVQALTKAGFGEAAKISYWTDYAGPNFPPVAEVLEGKTTNTTISIKFAAGHSGVIKYRIIVEDARNHYGIVESQLTDFYSSADANLPYYIAGELYANDLPEEDYHNFVIGDGNSYGGYPNVPLFPGIVYNIRILTVVMQNGRENAVISEAKRYVIVMNEEELEVRKGMFGLPELHFILGTVGFLVLVTIILFVIGIGICRYRDIKRKKKNCFTIHDPTVSEAKTWSVVYKVSDYEATDSPVVYDHQPLHYISENASTVEMKKVKKSSNAGSIIISDLTNHVYEQNTVLSRNFSEEFEKLSNSQSSSFHVAKKPENIRKNRYGNILPYDHSRVILKPIPDVSMADYINASYINGYNRPKEYIATQGPKENTILDFWRMVWQENTTVIVMITGLVENGKRKCSKYWPDDSVLYGELQVLLSHTEPCMDFVIRTLLIRQVSIGETRRIRHYQFLDWPDHTVPSNAASLLAMVRRIRTENSNITGPVIVHCSAGIGRSGTFIAIDCLWQQAQREEQVNVLELVNKLRMQRTNMVQNLEQYTFIYEALIEAIQYGNTAVMADELPLYLRELCLVKPGMEISELEFQHMTLSKINMHPGEKECSEALSETNIYKNRDPMIVPTNQMRLKLNSTKEDRSNYINAVAVDGYKHKNAFLVTQMPLTHTIEDFWRMIYEYNSSLIIMLNDIWKADASEDKGQYWPSEGFAQHGSFEVQVVTFEDQGSIITRTMKLSNTKKSEEDPHRIIQLQYMDWAHSDMLPVNSASMLALLNQVNRWYRHTTGGPITIHCRNGADRCGVFCAANYICDKLKTEHVVDVFHAVKKIRTTRPEFISTLEQYKFCYEVALELIDSYSIYSNFKRSC